MIVLALGPVAACAGGDGGTPARADAGTMTGSDATVPPTGWKMVAAGGDHACAIAADETVWCWGSGDGKLGNGSTARSTIPVPVSGLSEVTHICAGFFSSCAVTADGSAYCWGVNDQGQLGTGDDTSSAEPAPVFGLSDATAIACGDGHSCALRIDGTVSCWGFNTDGQLGNGRFDVDSFTPVMVTDLIGATSVSAAAFVSCATTAAGSVYCWGENLGGMLGTGATDFTSDVPIEIIGVSNAAEVAAGDDFICARTNLGEVWCWGGNGSGELGDGTYTDSETPVRVLGVSGAVALAAGVDHACAVDGSGALYCWGSNTSGKGGLELATADSNTPQAISGISGAIHVAAGDTMTCAIASGRPMCWGRNDAGQLGTTSVAIETSTPTPVEGT